MVHLSYSFDKVLNQQIDLIDIVTTTPLFKYYSNIFLLNCPQARCLICASHPYEFKINHSMCMFGSTGMCGMQ